MKLRGQLYLGFLSLAALILVMGGYSIFSQYQLKQTTESLYNGPLMVINFARSAQFGWSQIEARVVDLQRPLVEAKESSIEPNALIKEIEVLRDSFEGDLSIVGERIGIAEGRAAVAEIRTATKVWDEAWGVFVTARAESFPPQLRGRAAELSAASALVRGQFDDLVEYAAQEGYEFLEAANIKSAWEIRLNIGLIALGVIGGVLLVLLMARRIITPTVRLTSTVRHLAEGRSDVEVEELRRQDEIGELSSAIKRLQVNFSDTIQITQRIADGDLTCAPTARSESDALSHALEQMLHNLNEIVGTIRRVAGNVAAGSSQLQGASRGVSDGASDQANTIEQTSTSMEEMLVAIRQNAENAEQTERVAARVAEDAKQGAQSVQLTANSMREIAGKIGIVDEITRKIDLLALNASVEAARAGEHGKGFAVVASEVSKLAELSKEAAAEITRLSSEGTELAEATNRMLTELLPEFEKTKDLVQGISASSEEQSASAEQINRAVQQLHKVIQQNASAAEEMAAMSESLSGQANDLENTVQFFRTAGAGHDKVEAEANTAQPSAPVRRITHADERTMQVDTTLRGVDPMPSSPEVPLDTASAEEIERGDFGKY